MKPELIIPPAVQKFNEDILGITTCDDWANQLTAVNDMLVAYILEDKEFVSNHETSTHMFYLRELRNFFKSIQDIENKPQ